jgi:N-methylhydantoinase A
MPEIREFERASTTALNAYLQPGVGAYLARLEGALAQKHFAGTFHIVQSNGGVMSTRTARHLPVRTALSGPAAGVIAAAAIARATGTDNVITCDLGGTSFDVSVVAGGKASLAAQTTIDFGMVIRTPMIEITTIGAGGGSIASVDRGGLLQVGPESAGSVPGPACYGQGNERPTLTDAHVVLGRINATRPIGTLAALDVEAAKRAIQRHVAEPLKLDVMQAAEAIVRVADARMAGAIRLVSIERGHDPAKFAAMPFGGGGALHVGALIKEIGLKCAVVPRFPGVTSALGCVIADLRHDQVQTLNLNVDGLDIAALDRRMMTAGKEARAVVDAAGIAVDRVDVVFELDMHYHGQTHTVAVPLPVTTGASGTDITEAAIRAAFDKTYEAAFGRLLPGIPTRIVSLRTAAIGRRPVFDLSAFAPGADASLEKAAKGARKVFHGGAWHDTKVWSRLDLPTGAVIEGPAVLEQPDATIFIDPGLKATVDPLGNVIVERA